MDSSDHAEARQTVATACRILAARGLVQGVLGHVSARTGPDECLLRCRGPEEWGLGRTRAEDIRLVDRGGRAVDGDDRWAVPKEYPIHTVIYRRRPEVAAVVHAHPPAALLYGLSGLVARPVFGAYNIPAMRMARDGIPVYPRPILIARDELADEMLATMGRSTVCLLRGHGITVVGPSVEAATVAAVNLTELLSITVELARLGAHPPDLDDVDAAELPDLGSGFNDALAWRALVAELDE